MHQVLTVSIFEKPEEVDSAVQAAGPSGRAAKPGYFAQTPDGTRFSATSFSNLNLSRPLVKACDALGYTNPTPIQVGSSSPSSA